MSWRLSALDFSVLWERAGFDQLPYPFGFTSQAETLEESMLERHRSAQTFESRPDDGLEATVSALARARVRVEVFGTQWQPREMPIRVLGGVSESEGVVAVQFPGHTPSAGADVILSRCGGAEVVRKVVELLPRAAQGRTRPFTVEIDRVDEEPRQSVLRRADEVSPRMQLRELAGRPRTGQGELSVSTGFSVSEVSESQSWVDVAGDGRYLARRANGAMVVQPAAAEVVVAAVDEMVGRAWRRRQVS